MVGKIVTKDEEKDEVLDTFFVSVSNSKSGYPQDSDLLSWYGGQKKSL